MEISGPRMALLLPLCVLHDQEGICATSGRSPSPLFFSLIFLRQTFIGGTSAC